MSDIPQRPPSPRKTWIERNLAWFIAAVFGAGLVIFGGFYAAAYGLVFGFMRHSTPYASAMARVRADQDVRDVLGAPIHAGWFITGHIDTTGSGGVADLAIPISAPKGKAVVYVLARRFSGVWHLTVLVVDVPAANERIDLLRRGRQTPPQPPRSRHPPPKRGMPAGGVQV